MAKATRHGGASLTPEEQAGMEETPRIRRPGIEPISRAPKEEQPSVGDNSTQSVESPSTSDDNSSPSPQVPARTTESPSVVQEPAPNSDAPTTVTRGQTNPRKRSGKTAAAKSADEEKPDDFSDF